MEGTLGFGSSDNWDNDQRRSWQKSCDVDSSGLSIDQLQIKVVNFNSQQSMDDQDRFNFIAARNVKSQHRAKNFL